MDSNYLMRFSTNTTPHFLFLSETKQDFASIQGFQSHFGFDNLVTVDPISRVED